MSGLSDAEPFEGLVVRQQREWGLEDGPVRDGRFRDRDGHRLDEAHHRRLVDEAHLEVELGELRLAIAAQVLVAIAASDLHVAVDPADHQQLLELLRALRERIDGAWLEAARDDEVACALGRALDQGRRLDLDEAVGVMDLADGLDHPAPEQESPLHRLTTEVEVAVLETEDLVDRGVRVVDVEGRRLRLGQDRDVGGLEFDGTGREARVLGPGKPRRDGADDRHDELRSRPARLRVGDRRIGLIDDDLGQPVSVTKVEEDELTVVASPVDPAGQAGRLAGIRRSKCAAGVGPIGRGEARRGVAHGRRIVAADPGRAGDAVSTTEVSTMLSDCRVHTTLPTSDVDRLRTGTRASSGSRRSPSDRTPSSTGRASAACSRSRKGRRPRPGRIRRWPSPSPTSTPKWPT